MADCSKSKNPLFRSGINQAQRFLPALDEKFVQADENKMEHWLTYARNLGAFIKYYNSENQNQNENWQPFFDTDIAAQLALIAVQDVEGFKKQIRILLNSILSKEFKNNQPQLRKNFGLLFSMIFCLSVRLEYYVNVLPQESEVRKVINNLILIKLAPLLKRFIGYYKAAESFNPKVLDDEVLEHLEILGAKHVKLSECITLLKTKLSKRWIYRSASVSFEDYYNNVITADDSIFNETDLVNKFWEVLNTAANHNLFTGIFAEFVTVYARVAKVGKDQLVKAVTEQNDHEPHYALYLTFLHLFKYAQDELNLFTGRHLDFYYKDVLRVKPKAAKPNNVHLLLEPSSVTREHLIKKGTEFSAGKDSAGKDVFYESTADLVVNKGAVAQIRSLYFPSANDVIQASVQEGLVFASPVAASSDGIGGKLVSESKDWHPFGNKFYKDGKLDSINMPSASIGFAIASHYLFLKEGKRNISVSITGENLDNLKGKKFICYITGEKGWIEKSAIVSDTWTSPEPHLTIALDPADPVVAAYSTKIHKDIFQNLDTPLIKFVLANEAGNNQYKDLADVKVASIDLTVEVGNLKAGDTNGIKELLISSDTGSVDPSKPYLVFGSNPKSGAGWVIGNKEVFSKKGAEIMLSLKWAESIDYVMNDNNAALRFLENGVWDSASFKFADLYKTAASTMAAVIPNETVVSYKDEYSQYDIGSRRGFLKIENTKDYKVDKYYSDLQVHLVEIAAKVPDADKKVKNTPAFPYLPKVQYVYLSYKATDKISFNSTVKTSDSQFIHIYPFGYLNYGDQLITDGKMPVVPLFTHKEETDNGTAFPFNSGELYIGISGVETRQRISLLFKLLEGSTNPLEGKPENHVYWSYMSNNTWIEFGKDEIRDATRQLIETGIIDFPIPDNATLSNTVLPAGLLWLRASVKELPDQVCRFIDVKAQAVLAVLKGVGYADDFLQLPLPAKTISKLKEPQAAIRSVEQPFASFGGRNKETSKAFYNRVSERLRHKNRAITIRDFEQLVLEEFPEIHKVKCLNHTRLELNQSGVIYNEQAAGHVTVITIPDLRQKNAIDPLRPYTSRNLLDAIKKFLEERSNCNMRLHIENPLFEEVRVEADVVLKEFAQGNDSFYTEELQKDLVRFMTPWAYNDNSDISFGGKITKSEIINFIEEREYVDFILDLKINHNKMDGSPELLDLDQITTSTSRSVLVSCPASKHSVTILPQPENVVASECE
jgi:hypothetical protein